MAPDGARMGCMWVVRPYGDQRQPKLSPEDPAKRGRPNLRTEHSKVAAWLPAPLVSSTAPAIGGPPFGLWPGFLPVGRDGVVHNSCVCYVLWSGSPPALRVRP